MPKARVWPFSAFVDQACPLLFRIEHNGENITQSAISSISVVVKRVNDGSPVATYGPATVTVGTAVFDTLQTDGRWEEDDEGYNFICTIPAAAFPEIDECFVTFVFTPASGTPFVVVCRGTVIGNAL